MDDLGYRIDNSTTDPKQQSFVFTIQETGLSSHNALLSGRVAKHQFTFQLVAITKQFEISP